MFGKTASLAHDIDARFYERGGRLDVAREVYPDAPEPWIDLSAAISPWSHPFPALSGSEMHRYPDAAALRRLADTARRAYRAPSVADAVPVPGVNVGLSILPWLFREPKRVAILAPNHAGHAAAWEAAGHSVSQIESLDQSGKAAILIAVNPSHGDGRFVPHAELAAALQPLKRRNGLLIVDETFADGDESHSLLPEVGRLDYTLVLRSLGEFYGAAGIGLGFAITSHPIAERLRAALGRRPGFGAGAGFRGGGAFERGLGSVSTVAAEAGRERAGRGAGGRVASHSGRDCAVSAGGVHGSQ